MLILFSLKNSLAATMKKTKHFLVKKEKEGREYKKPEVQIMRYNEMIKKQRQEDEYLREKIKVDKIDDSVSKEKAIALALKYATEIKKQNYFYNKVR